ncbi:MAG TPA: ABC transporter permease [Longimicrobiales bacterium]|nr:ABC transporter permease [Longimicrobiales bacterium]
MADLELALRTLVKSPFVTLIAVVSLALGIGANAAIFSLTDQMLLQALPVRDPGSLVNLGAPGPKGGALSCNQAGDCEQVFSYPMFRDLERQQTSFTGLAAHRAFGANLALGDQTVDGEGMLVSGSYFPVLGVRPALGRLFGPGDDQAVGEHPVAILAYRFWENQLGSDPDVLNSAIVVNGRTMTVVGVAPRGFRGTTLGARPDVFVPLTMRGAIEPGFDAFENRRSYWAYVFGRLEPGVAMDQAATAMNTLYSGIVNEVEVPLYEGLSEQTMARFRAKQLTFEEGWRGQSSVHEEARIPLILLFAITGIVLLIACANIANLLLARGAGRTQEMAIRGSLGASRRQLLRQLLTESLLLALLGGAASLLVARWTLGVIGAILPAEAGSTLALELRPGIILFAAAVSIGTGILFGLYPAIHATRADLATIMKNASGQPSGSRGAARFRTSLVTAQIALSMALLVAAGLFTRSLTNVSRVELGLRADNMITFGISPELNGYEPARAHILFGRVEEELAAVPGVTGVTASYIPILAGSNWANDVSVEGFESGPDVDDNARFNAVGTGYFRTMGIPLIAGREFTTADGAGAAGVAIVNESFTRKFGLDTRRAVGALMAVGDTDELDMQIVGVVQDAKYSSVKDDIPAMYFSPYRQNESLGSMNFYVRTAGEPRTVVRAIPGVIKGLDANLPVQDLKTLRQQARENVFLDRMISSLAAAFAILATLLAAIGLYGVLAYTVAQRTREIGLRMALGAESAIVRTMVLRQVARMLVSGGVVGIIAALALGRATASLLYGVGGSDPLALAGAVILLGLVALGAAYLPALRASRVDPMQALRYE